MMRMASSIPSRPNRLLCQEALQQRSARSAGAWKAPLQRSPNHKSWVRMTLMWSARRHQRCLILWAMDCSRMFRQRRITRRTRNFQSNSSGSNRPTCILILWKPTTLPSTMALITNKAIPAQLTISSPWNSWPTMSWTRDMSTMTKMADIRCLNMQLYLAQSSLDRTHYSSQ